MASRFDFNLQSIWDRVFDPPKAWKGSAITDISFVAISFFFKRNAEFFEVHSKQHPKIFVSDYQINPQTIKNRFQNASNFWSVLVSFSSACWLHFGTQVGFNLATRHPQDHPRTFLIFKLFGFDIQTFRSSGAQGTLQRGDLASGNPRKQQPHH